MRILPLTAIYVAMLTFNNLCLNFVEVSFYQVARSLTIIFNIVLTYFVLHNKTSRNAIYACCIVFIGFIMGSYGESHFSFLGLVFGVCSSIFVALYGIYVKKKLQVVDNNEWRLLHYNTTLAILLLVPIVMFSGEIGEIKKVSFLRESSFWVVMTITGVTGFLINISTFLQIKFTTPLTNTISGTAKACVQTVLSVIIFKNPITHLNGFGIFLVLLGSSAYSFVRYYKL
ncbi:GDP-fucose transporter [Piromyces finnis]|uniref:GDP-fucose transporter n=1 Tax=Piromyces finnis TaxID=1754191 RepID=A0A1Y1V9W7_9FUNG|nr:GDP-fucose transporter [Piromyces finnis]|eukprot:ORX50760.1 GDP-fucose transporter [Piromyces finnis]